MQSARSTKLFNMIFRGLAFALMYSNEIGRVTKKWLNAMKATELFEQKNRFLSRPFFLFHSTQHLEISTQSNAEVTTGSVRVNRIAIEAARLAKEILEIEVQ